MTRMFAAWCLGVFVLHAGCAPRDEVGQVRQIAGEALAWFDANGFEHKLRPSELEIRWADLSRVRQGDVAGLVPWRGLIILDIHRVRAPFVRWEKEVIAHEAVHCMQIERFGRGPVGWSVWYLVHGEECEAEARLWARRWAASKGW